jgi:hypothetical protein
MSDQNDRRGFELEILRRFGAKWAVLTAMTADMANKGINVPTGVIEGLKIARVKIGSGCFSPCEVNCELGKAEGQIFSQCNLLDEKDFQQWCDLLAEAMQGKLDYERIRGIAALEPVKNDCQFLGCACASSR